MEIYTPLDVERGSSLQKTFKMKVISLITILNKSMLLHSVLKKLQSKTEVSVSIKVLIVGLLNACYFYLIR